MQLSLVLPCYNEEANIERVVREAFVWFESANIDGEVIVTDDGSRDRSQDILVSLEKTFPRLRVIQHGVNRGCGAAFSSGCDRATMEYIAFIDSDGQFNVQDIALLLPSLSSFDFVAGIRAHRADPFHRKLNAALYTLLLRYYIGLKLTDVNCAMKIFKRSLWSGIRPTSTGAIFSAEVFLALKTASIPWKEIPVPHYPRTAGAQTGAKLSVILRMFKELAFLKRKKERQVVEP